MVEFGWHEDENLVSSKIPLGIVFCQASLWLKLQGVQLLLSAEEVVDSSEPKRFSFWQIRLEHGVAFSAQGSKMKIPIYVSMFFNRWPQPNQGKHLCTCKRFSPLLRKLLGNVSSELLHALLDRSTLAAGKADQSKCVSFQSLQQTFKYMPLTYRCF